MYYTIRNRIPRLPALLAAYLFFSAGMTPAARPLEPGAAAEAASMPVMEEMPEMPEMPGDQTGSPEKLTPYQTGVQAYLKGNDEEAVSRLQEALRLNADDEKAKRLLLKVMLRAINGNYERNNYKKAHSLIQAARRHFPANPEVKLLYSSMLESGAAEKRKLPAARPENPPAQRTAATSRRLAAVRLPTTPPAPQKTVQIPEVSTPSRVSAPPLKSPAPKKTAGAPEPGAGRDNAAFFAAGAAALLLSAALFIFVYRQQKQQKALLLRIESLQKALVDGEVKKVEIYRELETRKNLEKQDEELAALRKAKEQRMYQELEKLKAGEETKILAELAEKRREAERAAHLELEASKVPSSFVPELLPDQPAPPPAPGPAGTGGPRALPAYPLPASGPGPADDKSQEDKILKILADITPPEREAAWGRIAVRVTDIYEASPEAAMKFLYELAKDENPLNRASIAGALAAIGAPAALDLLFELYTDASLEVRREAIKHLTRLQRDLTIPIDETYRGKISACLREEKAKGDWVF